MSDIDLLEATPGSDLAIEHGCTCPVFDNSYGKGYMGQKNVFVINALCPLHGDLEEEESGGVEKELENVVPYKGT